jgi:hypothetical protein
VTARKKLEREVATMFDRLKDRGLLDDVSKAHAEGAKRLLPHMPLVEVAHLHTACKHALKNAQPLKIRRN